MGDYLLYHIVVLLPALLYFLNLNDRFRNGASKFLIVLTGVFLCFGYMTGSDWITYEMVYDFESLHVFYEPAYVALMNLGYLLQLSFFPFLIGVKLFCYFVIVKKLKELCGVHFLLGFSFFISFFGLYLFIDNPLRNLIAIVFFLLSIRFFNEKRYVVYVLLGVISVSFHKTALIMFLIPLFLNLSFKKLYRVLLLSVFVFITLGVTGVFNSLFTIIIEFIPFFNKYLDSYLEGDSEYVSRESINAKSIIFILLFGLIIMNQKFSKNKDETYVYKFFLIYVVMFLISIFIPIFDRFTFYLSIFFVVIVVKHAFLFRIQTRLIYNVGLFLLLIINTHTLIMNKQVYLPYSNYLSYTFKEKPSFEYRSSYNAKLSPAKKK